MNIVVNDIDKLFDDTAKGMFEKSLFVLNHWTKLEFDSGN
jgi:hypothetical protein